jgi:hypothetical protein
MVVSSAIVEEKCSGKLVGGKLRLKMTGYRHLAILAKRADEGRHGDDGQPPSSSWPPRQYGGYFLGGAHD